jgi:hypothetical protein
MYKIIPYAFMLLCLGLLSGLSAQPCVADHSLSGSETGTTGYRAMNDISSTQDLATTSDVRYIAGNVITLNPGFIARNGATFHAFNEDCNVGIEDLKNQRFSVANYPNPFSQQTRIVFYLEKTAQVEIRVQNSLGQVVARPLRSALKTEGEHEVVFDGSKLPAGIYSYTLRAGEKLASGQMVVRH